MRASAAAWGRPFNEVFNLVKTSVFSKRASSSKIGATPIELDFGFAGSLWCGGS
jgi:hypothetical protein